MTHLPDHISEAWHSIFGSTGPSMVIRAPGRVNIIGEHTDYNEGWVMPGAINRFVYVLVAENPTGRHHWAADNLDESVRLDLDDITLQDMPLWAKYLAGAISMADTPARAFSILIAGDLSVGAGLSSSSALVCAMIFALHQLDGKQIDRVEIANLGRKVERDIIGLQGGIMDQFAIMLSIKDSVMKLDCRDLSYEFISADFHPAKWTLINTKVKHQLVDSDYNERANECKEAIIYLQQTFPEIMSLRDVTVEMLQEASIPPLLHKRSLFVVEENQRVHAMADALQKKDANKAGELLRRSHAGLQHQYEVSCAELDMLVAFANQYQGVYGARMMGGGFGGCVLCLAEENVIHALTQEASHRYNAAFGYPPEIIDFELTEGVSVI
jgi:galactokinase